jgi:transposase
MIDSSIIRIHQHAAGQKKQADGTDSPNACIGRSRGGWTTKIHVCIDALGNSVRTLLSAGQQADITYAETLMDKLYPKAILADKAYDSDAFIKQMEGKGCEIVIPPKCNRIIKREIDRNLYKDRNKVERYFNRLKHYRRIATRYDKTARNFMAFIVLAMSNRPLS